jgi:hypothetical protein
VGFAAPWFLAGLAVLAVPFYVHLLRQHKSTPLPFSSLMFFEQRTQSSIRHRRLKYLALLALRAATIVLIALTFAGFYVSCSAMPAARNALKVIAIDRSLSMKAGGRMDAAKTEASQSVGEGQVQVIAFDSQAQLLTQQTSDPAEARTAIASVTAGDGASSYGELARAIRAIAQAVRTPVEAHIYSDMQRSSLPSPFSELALPPNVKLMLHPVASSREPNFYVENVVAPRHVFQPDKLRIQATIAGAGNAPRDVTATLVVNGTPSESRRVQVLPNSRATTEFVVGNLTYGFNRAEVRIDTSDALAQDNVFPFAMERRETSRVLFVGNERAALYFRTALESVPNSGFTVDVSSSAHIAPDKYAFVVLHDIPAAPPELQQYVSRGGGLLIALGAASAAAERIPVAGEKVVESRYSSRAAERFQSVASVDTTHPAVQFTNGFDDVKLYQTIGVEPGNARVVAKLTDGTPLILDKRVGEGRVLVFASTFDNIANDLPLHGSFIPFVEQAARYLSGYEGTAAQFAVGSFVDLRGARDAGTGVEVIGPDGGRALSLEEAASARAFQLPREGFFEIRRANGRNELIAAHADRRESDLDIIPAETLALWQNTGNVANAPGSAPASESESRRSLWRWFAIALLVTGLAESLFASRYLREQQAEPKLRKAAA